MIKKVTKSFIQPAPGQLEQWFAELFDNYVLLVNAQRCLTPPTVSDIFDLTRLVPGKNGAKNDNRLSKSINFLGSKANKMIDLIRR